MTEAPRPSPAAQVTAIAGTPGGLLTLAAVIYLAAYVVFEIALSTYSFPTLGTIAAIFILIGQYRPTGAASVLSGKSALLILGLVLFLEALTFLIYDVRGGYVAVDHIEDLIAQIAHYAAGAVAGVAAFQLMR
jgi:hypothetical protein